MNFRRRRAPTGRAKPPLFRYNCRINPMVSAARFSMPNPMLAYLIRKKQVSRRRKILALIIAATVDGLRLMCGGVIGFLDPLDDLADFVTALLLWLVLGPSWAMAAALIIELIPGLGIFPSWTALALVVLAMPQPAVDTADAPPDGAEKHPTH